MKKLFLLLVSAVAIAASAQTIRIIKAPSSAKRQLKAVDKALYRVTYSAKAVTDTTRRDSAGYVYSNDVMRLDIGSTVSRFYSYNTYLHDSVFAARRKSGERVYTGIPRKGNLSWELFRGLPAGKTLFIDQVGIDSYRVEEDQESPEWQIVADSTRTLLGYPCTMATTTFKGRTWTAWYTEDIPLDNGPWKLCGLPGLILSAASADRQYVFQGEGLQQINGADSISYDLAADKYERVSMKQLNEMWRRFRPIDQFGSKNFQMSSKDAASKENEERIRKYLNSVQPCNPIEL